MTSRYIKNDNGQFIKGNNGKKLRYIFNKNDKKIQVKFKENWTTDAIDKLEFTYTDFQIEYENKLKMKGEFNKYAQTKILENQKAYLRDMEQSIDDFEKTDGKQSWFNSVGVNDVELEEEKWEMGKEEFAKVVNEAREFIKNARENVEKAEKQLQGDK